MGNDREVVEGSVFRISYSYNSSIGTYTYIKYYDKKYLKEIYYESKYNGRDGMTGCSTSEYAYFKAIKCGSTKIILGHKYRGIKKENSTIKIKIKKNDGKTPVENIIEKEIREENPIKICLIGDDKVGKTSLIRRFNGESFNDKYEKTLQVDNINKKITHNNKEIESNIYGINGNDLFGKLYRSYYKDSSIIIFVYDITNKNSFVNANYFWYQDIQRNIKPKPMMVILGNKIDLYEAEEVKEEKARDCAKSRNSKFKLFSAKTDSEFDKFFEELIEDYFKFIVTQILK